MQRLVAKNYPLYLRNGDGQKEVSLFLFPYSLVMYSPQRGPAVRVGIRELVCGFRRISSTSAITVLTVCSPAVLHSY